MNLKLVATLLRGPEFLRLLEKVGTSFEPDRSKESLDTTDAATAYKIRFPDLLPTYDTLTSLIKSLAHFRAPQALATHRRRSWDPRSDSRRVGNEREVRG